MWTTSNSLGSRVPLAVLLIAVSSGCAETTSAPEAPGVAPDAPRVRQVARSETPNEPTSTGYLDQFVPVELLSVSVRRLAAADETLRQRAGPSFLAEARDPLVIEVVTARDLGNLARTSSPEIYLNGKRVGDTWALDQTRLVAFLPDRSRIKPRNSITVAWLGNEQATRTRHALTFTADDVR